jgi:hypothetical protein
MPGTVTESMNEIPQTETGPATDSAKPQKRFDEWQQRINACKIYRKKLIANWTINIDYRRGKPFASQTDEDRVVVNLDWSLTKAKHAALFSQIPQVHVDHAPQTQTAGEWLYAFEQRLNDTLVTAGIESAMDECMVDCINAAGIGAILVSHESISEEKQIASLPPEAYDPQTMLQPDGTPVPMQTVPQVYDHRYLVQRISPADLLWPINFTGSDFDQAPWIGRTGRISWAQAVQRFGLTEEDKQSMLGEERSTLDRLVHDIDKDKTTADEMVSFDEVFYKEYCFDEQAKSYTGIHHLVYVTGKDEPVVDESWKGQEVPPQGGNILGAQRFPVRVLTLSYLTDETIPPSDTAIGRPQVNEINKSRTQMILQRERSIPIRWADVNRVDPTIMQSLMRGSWQNIIPVQGQGTNILGEVARASHPQENFAFDKIAKSDLSELWQVGEADSGANVETKGEADVIQNQMSTRIGRERARVSKFFVSVSEVLGGLLCLYEDAQSFGQGFDPNVSRTLTYSILADSTVLVDSQQRLQRLIQFINFAAKSGWVDIEPVMKEIAQLSGLDPATVIKPPMPKPPVEPNISLRLTGTEDMLQPLTLAFLMKSGQAPSADLIEQAKQLIQISVTAPPNAQNQSGPVGPDGLPLQPGMSADGTPLPPGASAPLPPSPLMPGMQHMAVPPPQPPIPRVGEAHPNWSAMSRINKRSDEV